MQLVRATCAAAVFSLCLTGCPPGRDIPAPSAMVPIPGGTFTLGPATADSRPPACGAETDGEIERCDSGRQDTNPLEWLEDLTFVPPATVTIPNFEIDVHEVTNLQYEYCVEMGGCTAPVSSEVSGETYYGAVEHAGSPVVWVTHQQALEYCAFVEKNLPTEAQWERAARHSLSGEARTFPWDGAAPANCVEGSGRYALAKGCRQTPAAADYSNDDRTDLGVRNMASNVSEWVLDGWHPYAYCEDRQAYDQRCQLEPQAAACPACVADGSRCGKSCVPSRLVICRAGQYSVFLGNSSEWVLRGGSWNHGVCYHRLYVRRKGTNAQAEVGFRCAR